MYNKIVESYSKMQEIDRLGAFEKDDESGTTFQLLNEVITKLKDEFSDGTQEENNNYFTKITDMAISAYNQTVDFQQARKVFIEDLYILHFLKWQKI
jgi:hypothetical protein